MRICVFGNSHAASLKSGWDAIAAEHREMQLTFFAARQRHLQGLRLDGRRLVPQTESLARDIAFTSGGLAHVDLDAFDLFVCYGLGLFLPSLDVRCSSEVMKQTCLDILSGSLSIELCRMLRAASGVPIYLGHNPQKASPNPSPESRNGKLSYAETRDLMKEHLGVDDVTIVAQPGETLVNHWTTLARFSTGSTRLDVGDGLSGQAHPSTDVGHMNGEFGQLWLQALFQSLP